MKPVLCKSLCAAVFSIMPVLSYAQAVPIDNVDQIEHALMHGLSVRSTFDLSACKNDNPAQPSPPVRGGLVIDPFNILPNGVLAFANTHGTVDPAGRALTEIIRFRVNPSGVVNVSVSTFAMPSYQLLNATALTCGLSADVHFFASFL